MKYRLVLCLLVAVVSFLFSPESPFLAFSAAAAGSDKVEKRVLKFPASVCVGSILLGPMSSDWQVHFGEKQVSGAQGVITLNVPKGYQVIFDANSNVVRNPKILDNLDVAGVDAVHIAFIAVDEKEEGKSDEAVAHLGRFTNLVHLNLNRSDASDRALECLQPLKSLKAITAYGANIRGSAFKSLSRFPQLKVVDFSACPVQSIYLKDLAAVPGLEAVGLGKTRLHSNDLQNLKYLVPLQHLTTLELSSNLIDDNGISYLAPLKQLKTVALRDTKVSATGLRPLQNRHMVVQLTRISASDRQFLKKEMPGLVVTTEPLRSVDSETKKLCAPLK